MWRPISSDRGRLAVPLKSLKRLSSLRLRLRLRSGAGLASFGFGRVGRSFAPSLLASPAPGSSLLVFQRHRQRSRFHLMNTSKLVGFGCILVCDCESWLGD